MKYPCRRFVIPLVLTAFSFFPAIPPEAKDKKQQEAEALLAKARELSDIRCEGCPPFRLKARIRAWNSEGGSAGGAYDLTRCSPTRWREEINILDFSQLRIGGDGKIWLKRSIDFLPFQISMLTQLLDLRGILLLKRVESIGRVNDKTGGGRPLKCVELKEGATVIRSVCFDEEAGALVREELARRSFEYDNYAIWQGKPFPGVMRAFRTEGPWGDERVKPVVELQMENIDSGNCQDSCLFTPPDTADEQLSCESPEQPEVVEMKRPVYAISWKLRRIQGVVEVYGVVGTDGKLHNLRVLRSAHPELAAATLSSLRGWRYRPAMCNDVPVRAETVVDMTFTLKE